MTSDYLVLEFEAPLMSFGAPIVDERGLIQPMPALSMVAGIVGNSLGYSHGEFGRLDRLQGALRIASRADRPGRRMTDFQTVDFMTPEQRDRGDIGGARVIGWTTRGRPEKRTCGTAQIENPHIRRREYWADARHTITLGISSEDGLPGLGEIAKALRAPARPLFLGRKCCLPSRPICVRPPLKALSPIEALCSLPTDTNVEAGDDGTRDVWFAPIDGPYAGLDLFGNRSLRVCDERDWRSQLHVGRRLLSHATFRFPLQESPSEANHG